MFLTSEEIYSEYAKCLLDPKYPITTYLRTFDKTQEGFVPFKLFQKQEEIVDCYENHRYNLITKPRQAGISTTTQAYAAIKCSLADPENPETIVVIANKLALAKKFTKGIKDFVVQLPRWMWGPEYYGSKENEKRSIFRRESQTEIELVNGSKIIAVATSIDALRGYTPTFLIFDEAAFIDNGSELYSAAITSLGTGGKAILISTPNGQDSLYYETYKNAYDKENPNGYNVIEMKWYQDPRYNKDLIWTDKDGNVINEEEFTHESYDLKIRQGFKPSSSWYRDMCRGMNGDKKKIAQELDVSFLGSGGNVVDDEFIIQQETENVLEPKWIDRTYFDGNSGLVYIWERPELDHKYLLSADVASGSGADFSTFSIIDTTTMTQVVEFQGKIPPDKFATIINQYGLEYDAYVVVDNINVGASTVLKLVEMGYPNLHYDDITPRALRAMKNNEVFAENRIPGFNASGVRLPLISHFEEMVRTNGIKIRSRRIINEMRTFIYKANGRPDHGEGKNDDCLMALAIGLWVLESSFKKLKKANNQRKAILSAWITNNDVKKTPEKENNEKENKKKPSPSFISSNTTRSSGNYSWLFSGLK